MTPENGLATYLIAITLLTLTPGVDTVLVIRNTARGGFRDGALSSLGICAGLLVHAAISAVGVSVILLQSAWAFRGLKLAGAAYLVWLGLVSLRNAARGGGGPLVHPEGETTGRAGPGRSLMEGFLSNILNPKAVVFYMAFLPQFIDPARSALTQALFLAGLHFAIAMVWQCVLAAMVDHAQRWIARRSVRRVLDSATGSVMTFFGIKLALSR
jgi:RhtB (resistance to homoserine/threonine) family protein